MPQVFENVRMINSVSGIISKGQSFTDVVDDDIWSQRHDINVDPIWVHATPTTNVQKTFFKNSAGVCSRRINDTTGVFFHKLLQNPHILR